MEKRAGSRANGCVQDDRELVIQFARAADSAAFEMLVKRHGPMVLNVCRRVLRDSHDAEDAFQSAFLVFFHKAHSIRTPAKVANWLYGVAYRTALNSLWQKSRAARRSGFWPRARRDDEAYCGQIR